VQGARKSAVGQEANTKAQTLAQLDADKSAATAQVKGATATQNVRAGLNNDMTSRGAAPSDAQKAEDGALGLFKYALPGGPQPANPGEKSGAKKAPEATTAAVGEEGDGGSPGSGTATTAATGEEGDMGSPGQGTATTAAVGEEGDGGAPGMSPALPGTTHPGARMIPDAQNRALDGAQLQDAASEGADGFNHAAGGPDATSRKEGAAPTPESGGTAAQAKAAAGAAVDAKGAGAEGSAAGQTGEFAKAGVGLSPGDLSKAFGPNDAVVQSASFKNLAKAAQKIWNSPAGRQASAAMQAAASAARKGNFKEAARHLSTMGRKMGELAQQFTAEGLAGIGQSFSSAAGSYAQGNYLDATKHAAAGLSQLAEFVPPVAGQAAVLSGILSKIPDFGI